MKIKASTVNINDKTKLYMHPLAKKLSQLLIHAYLSGSQEDYLNKLSQTFNCYQPLPIHNISVISMGSSSNEYQIIGGCFNPLFNIKELKNDNSIFISYQSSQKNIKAEHKKRAKAEFDQDIVNFIYLDFLRSISTLSLKKPGSMDRELRQITQNYKSKIWSEIFDNGGKNYLRQADLADLLNVTRDTLKKQADLNEL